MLLDILDCDINFGYSFDGWRLLTSVNAKPVDSMADLAKLWLEASDSCASSTCATATTEHGRAGAVFVDGGEALHKPHRSLDFVFSDESRIVLNTSGCIQAERAVLEQHGIPVAISPSLAKTVASSRLSKL